MARYDLRLQNTVYVCWISQRATSAPPPIHLPVRHINCCSLLRPPIPRQMRTSAQVQAAQNCARAQIRNLNDCTAGHSIWRLPHSPLVAVTHLFVISSNGQQASALRLRDARVDTWRGSINVPASRGHYPAQAPGYHIRVEALIISSGLCPALLRT